MKIPKNRLRLIIETHELVRKTPFKPTHEFYKFIEIGKRRFYQLIRNEKPLQFDEMQRLSDYFGVHILELHECTIPFLNPKTVA